MNELLQRVAKFMQLEKLASIRIRYRLKLRREKIKKRVDLRLAKAKRLKDLDSNIIRRSTPRGAKSWRKCRILTSFSIQERC